MLKGAVGKVMWVGRATVFLVGLAVILALVFGAASTALGANGTPFLLGKQNFATQVSKLVKRGDGPALSLQVKEGHSPMKVNSSGKVANLNADQLDGKSETDFYAAGSKAADSEKLDGKASSEFAADANQDGKADAAEHADSAAAAQNAADADKLDSLNSTDFQRANAAAGGDLSGNYPNPQLGSGSVGTLEVENGRLTADDIARFHGRYFTQGGTVRAQECSSDQVSVGSTNVDISNDVVIVTPGPWTDTRLLIRTSHVAPINYVFQLTFCNMTTGASLPIPEYVDYVIIGRP